MSQPGRLVSTRLRTPRAAAIAGLIFSVLLAASLLLLRRSVPGDPSEPGAWLQRDVASVTLALNLIPFAGVAFLWFVGVVRDRLGDREDRFFSSVFFGSALLFLAMLFTAAAVLAAIVIVFSDAPPQAIDSTAFHLVRVVSYNIVNVYAIKMASVFMISTSTVALRTGFVPRWISQLGLAFGLFILFASYYMSWSVVVLPIWVFLLSAHILIENYRQPAGIS